jgi:hypothetical protein
LFNRRMVLFPFLDWLNCTHKYSGSSTQAIKANTFYTNVLTVT